MSVSVDALTIHNHLWQPKRPGVPKKTQTRKWPRHGRSLRGCADGIRIYCFHPFGYEVCGATDLLYRGPLDNTRRAFLPPRTQECWAGRQRSQCHGFCGLAAVVLAVHWDPQMGDVHRARFRAVHLPYLKFFRII
jgi:hypothetical protein